MRSFIQFFLLPFFILTNIAISQEVKNNHINDSNCNIDSLYIQGQNKPSIIFNLQGQSNLSSEYLTTHTSALQNLYSDKKNHIEDANNQSDDLLDKHTDLIDNNFPIDQQFIEQTSILLPGVRNSSVAWGDYDNDGDLDILLTGLGTGNVLLSKIYRNEGNNTFSEQTTISLIKVQSSSAAWGDYDNDGDLDILLTGYDASATGVSKIYRNDGNNIFEEQVSITLIGVSRSEVAWGDYDNDGDLDILLSGLVVSAGVTKIYRNDGNNNFTPQNQITLSGVFAGEVAWGDYDNDGDLDVFLTGKYDPYVESLYTKVYRNDGNGNFVVQSTISLQAMGESELALGDYDSDGDLDLLLVGYRTGYVNASYIYRNEGNNSFVLQTSILLEGVQHPSIAWGDYDNDGDFDIILTGNNATTPISKIYQNDGNNNFIDQSQILLTAVKYSSVAWGDYDNDGDLDILLTGASSATDNVSKIYLNTDTTANVPPIPPSNLVAILNGNEVTFSWDKTTDEETPQDGLTYNLAVSTMPGGCNIVSPMADISTGYRKVVSIGNTNHNNSWTLIGLSPGTYYWSVQAIDNSFAGSIFANEEMFIIIPAAPEAPTDLTASVINQTQIDLEWTDNSEYEDGFIIERKQSSFTNWELLDTVSANLTTYEDTSVVTDTTYCYRVQAYNIGGISDYSNEACNFPHLIPSLTITNPDGGEIWQLNTLQNIEWLSENVTFIRIEISRDNGSNWSTIDSSYENSGTYNWLVSGDVSAECRIKITDVSDPIIWDTSAAVFSITPPTGIEEELLSKIPTEYKLYQNYPNPFNPSTKILYSIPRGSFVSIILYDLFGKSVRTLENEYKPSGNYELEFNASNLSSGIYFYQIKSGGFFETKKMILMK